VVRFSPEVRQCVRSRQFEELAIDGISGVAPPDTSDITSNTKFTAHFNRPSAQQSHTQNPATGNEISGVAGFTTISGISTDAKCVR
jgi:hypothetical protein